MECKFDFTPGPWITKYGINVYSEEKDRSICSCGINSSQKGIYEETEANARLIAYAPEMLMALIEHMKYNCASFYICIENKYNCSSKKDCRFLKTYKIIEKATGKKWSEING